MKREKIENNILTIFKKLVNITSVDEYEELQNLGISSVVYVQIIIEIEEKFNIEIPDELLVYEAHKTINKIINDVTTLLCN